jgi:60 kDa SS-A/Ro ribonucleoprotein
VREIFASNRNGVVCARWTHIDGFSENVIRYIQEIEARD